LWQDAVARREFTKRLGLTGVILTKLDGDARAARRFPLQKLPGQLVKVCGLGENTSAGGFYPEAPSFRACWVMGDIM